MESLTSTNRGIIAQRSRILEKIYAVSYSCFEKEPLNDYWALIAIEFLTMGPPSMWPELSIISWVLSDTFGHKFGLAHH